MSITLRTRPPRINLSQLRQWSPGPPDHPLLIEARMEQPEGKDLRGPRDWVSVSAALLSLSVSLSMCLCMHVYVRVCVFNVYLYGKLENSVADEGEGGAKTKDPERNGGRIASFRSGLRGQLFGREMRKFARQEWENECYLSLPECSDSDICRGTSGIFSLSLLLCGKLVLSELPAVWEFSSRGWVRSLE